MDGGYAFTVLYMLGGRGSCDVFEVLRSPQIGRYIYLVNCI